ncbi:putative peptidyl-tRNA hydrolase PTRHD1 [Nomia melanderi]|uniref:putative peptidyl-tRNA hydrolase PTRHD1 n=1 Tax=Nomia melanderi TaxID=2448451 RepID=UPI0013043FA6|nr:putative peptidyl-tRNA hydrolase PTRHD1 [Nomia melanderi]
MGDIIVQYVVLRRDLLKVMKWPVGAIVAQACHACTAVTHLFYNDSYMQDYLKNLDDMHKIVLEVPDESSLNTLSIQLKNSDIDHKLWIEQPENIPTCLVTKPYPKDKVKSYFKEYKLFKS